MLKEYRATTEISKKYFGKVNRCEVDIYSLSNLSGMKISVINYGGRITRILVPDKFGTFGDVVLGYSNIEGYIKCSKYLGAIIGRYANRIANGKFTLNGKEFTLTANNAPNHLHGGTVGFDKVIWEAEPFITENGQAIKLKYNSHDGEEGYPGNLKISVVYTLTDNNELLIDNEAESDADTIYNPTNHTYFNLKDAGISSILDHEIQINADSITPIDKFMIPTGNLKSVNSTPFDFREPRKIGERINDDDMQLKFGSGYDHNFVLNGASGKLRLAANLFEPYTGRAIEVLTTEPGVHFYSGNFLNGSDVGKNGVVYRHRSGLCLETQHFPDSPNQPHFPSTILRAGEKFKTRTIYKFSVRD